MPERTYRTRRQTLRAQHLRREASKVERKLWPHLRSSQTGAPFRRQHPVGPYFADYMCVPLNLVVEVDGPTHDLGRDAARDAFMAARGFAVMRFSDQEVRENLSGVVDTIRDRIWLLQHGGS